MRVAGRVDSRRGADVPSSNGNLASGQKGSAMDWIIWLIVIVAIVAIVWGLLNRNSRKGTGTSDAGTGAAGGPAASTPASANQVAHDGAMSGGSAAASAAAAATTGIPTAAGFGNAEPMAPTTAEDSKAARPTARENAAEPAAETSTEPAAETSAEPATTTTEGVSGAAGAAPAEWETQWSETPPVDEAHAAVHHEHALGGTAASPGAAGAPVHHPEYTESHAPTLPGAESAAAEAEAEAEAAAARPDAAAMPEAETAQTALSSAAAETAASHTAEPSGHLALDQPYGEGSAAPAADGSGPEGFTVKGNASSMIYHDETSASYEETRAEVWFESAAHAEAAGFRPPRRSRL